MELNQFTNYPIQKNSILIIEPNPYHGEILPGLTYYFQKLGYKVDIFLRNETVQQNPFSRFTESDKPRLFYGSTKEIRTTIQKNNLKQYDFIIFSSNAYWEKDVYWGSFLKFINCIPKPKFCSLFIEHNLNSLHKDDSMLFMNQKRVFTLYEFIYKGTKTAMLNPCYFGNIKITAKKKVPHLIVIGSINSDHRNYNLLLKAATELINKEAKFKITIIGKGKLYIPQQLEKYVKHLGKVNFPTMYDAMEESDFFLPLLDQNNKLHTRYLQETSSGSIQLILGFSKVPIISKKFASFYEFNNKNSILYDENNLVDGINKALSITSEDYDNLQLNISNYRDNIQNKSLNTLRDRLNSLKNKNNIEINIIDTIQLISIFINKGFKKIKDLIVSHF